MGKMMVQSVTPATPPDSLDHPVLYIDDGCMCVPTLPLLVATLMVIIDSVQGVQVLLVLMVRMTQLHLAHCLMLLVWPTCDCDQ